MEVGDIAAIVQGARSAAAGWTALVGLATVRAGPAAALLRAFPVEEHAALTARRLAELLRADPLTIDVAALFFALVDAVDVETGEGHVGLHPTGLARVPAESQEHLPPPTWSPPERFVTSRLLDAVRALSLTDDDHAAFYERDMMLGAAGLLVRSAVQANRVRVTALVGFDAGPRFAVT